MSYSEGILEVTQPHFLLLGGDTITGRALNVHVQTTAPTLQIRAWRFKEVTQLTREAWI